MFNQLKFAFSVSVLSALLIITPASEASLINYNFDGTVDSGLLTGEIYNGSFAFDNATLINTGSESIILSSLTFNFLTSNYTLNADLTPSADFLDGLFLGISYSASGLDPSFAFVSASGSGLPGDVPYFSYQTVSGDSGFGSLNITAVPLPAAIWLFASSLGLTSLFSRKKIKK
jgi:hypothetical protein